MFERNIDGRGVGMPPRIVQTLLDDAENGQFDRFRQTAEILIQAQAGCNAGASAPTMDIRLQSGAQTEAVNRRRTQIVT